MGLALGLGVELGRELGLGLGVGVALGFGAALGFGVLTPVGRMLTAANFARFTMIFATYCWVSGIFGIPPALRTLPAPALYAASASS